MSHVEWASSARLKPEYYGPRTFTDEHGNINAGHVLAIGSDSTLAIEGRVNDIRMVLEEALTFLPAPGSTCQGEVGDGWGCILEVDHVGICKSASDDSDHPCPNGHGPMVPRENPNPTAVALGTWFDCQNGCRSSMLVGAVSA